MSIPLNPEDIAAMESRGSDQDCTLDCDCDFNCNCYPPSYPPSAPPAPRPRGRTKGDPTNTGRRVGLTVPCWWGCGATVSGSTLQKHWRECPNRPKQ